MAPLLSASTYKELRKKDGQTKHKQTKMALQTNCLPFLWTHTLHVTSALHLHSPHYITSIERRENSSLLNHCFGIGINTTKLGIVHLSLLVSAPFLSYFTHIGIITEWLCQRVAFHGLWWGWVRLSSSWFSSFCVGRGKQLLAFSLESRTIHAHSL